MVGLLNNKVAGPIIKTSLLAPTNIEALSAHLRVQAEKDYREIVDGASIAIGKVYNHALNMRGMQSSSAWPSALLRFLPLIRALLNQDESTGGAELAWKAGLKVGRLCNIPPDGSECRIQEGEEECDGFHVEMDDLLVEICKVQKSRGQIDWLKDGRAEEVVALAKSPSWEIYVGKNDGKHPGDYRYQKVVKFLKTIR